MSTSDPVIYEIKENSEGRVTAIATLNSEKTLNSLSAAMIDSLTPKLKEWAEDEKVACVVLKGAGEKAFCAGGDIKALYDKMVEHPIGEAVPEANEFFEKEYHLDHLIHTYKKPFVCLGHGIVMGGGLGLFAGASHRIVSERSMIAMPEITIGLYPDVGASWFLNRMPGRTGLFLGLTGSRMKAADTQFVGLSDFFILREKHEELEEKIVQLSWHKEARHNHTLLNKLCREFSGSSEELGESSLRTHYDFIQKLTDVDSIHEFKDKLESLQVEDKWIQFAQKTFMAGSPTSAGVIFNQLEHTKHMSLKECFDFEYKLSCKFAMHPDFREGIRALIVDKDQSPKWSPPSLRDLEGPEILKLLTGPLSNGKSHGLN